MPFRQRLIIPAQNIGAGFGQPIHCPQLCGGQPDAVGHMGKAVFIIRTFRFPPIKQAARHVRHIKIAGFLVLQLMKAAFAAAIAQSLPLAAIQRVQRALPKAVRGAIRAQRPFTLPSGQALPL
jgi:hypothetical protein